MTKMAKLKLTKNEKYSSHFTLPPKDARFLLQRCPEPRPYDRGLAKQLTSALNTSRYGGKPVRTVREVSTFLRHAHDKELTAADFRD
jgi:hypothetical protein